MARAHQVKVYLCNNCDTFVLKEVLPTHSDNLSRIVSFCRNKTDCRCELQLNYFGEKFPSDKYASLGTKQHAIIHRNKDTFTQIDMTTDAKLMN